MTVDAPGRRTTRAEELGRDGIDLYAMLGVTPDAPGGLARQLYWLKVEQHQQARAGGDESAAGRIDALNEALGIIIDPDLRSAYDGSRPRAATRVRPAAARSAAGRRRAGMALAVMLATVTAALSAAWLGAPVALAAVLLTGMGALVGAVTWQRRDVVAMQHPLALLALSDDADRSQIQTAYELSVQDLLSRVKFDPRVIRQLDDLDRAYHAAIRFVDIRDGAPLDPRTGRRIAPVVRGLLARSGARLIDALGRFALFALRWGVILLRRAGERAGGGAASDARYGAHRAADRLTAVSRRIQWSAEDDPRPLVGLDLERRVGAIDRSVTTPAAGDANAAIRASAPATTADEQAVEAYLVLESSAGNRRVPIGSVPLRLGSGPDCHLVLPAELGLAPEHALIWQRDGMLLMHVVDTAPGACFVNDEPMTWATLEHGDVVRLARASCRIEVA